MAKQLNYGDDARVKLQAGLDKVADAVKVTLGACGRNVILHGKFGTPHITKDGVTVADSISLDDVIENMGCSLIKEVASKTADVSGDGTSTATVLAQSIVSQGIKALENGANPMELKKGIDKAVVSVVKQLKELAIPITTNEELHNIAKISANGDTEIATLISDAMEMVGKSGVIQVEQSNSYETSIQIVEGMQLKRGYISPDFVTNASAMSCELINPCILIVDKDITSFGDLVPAIEKAQEDNRPIFIMADDVSGEALATVLMNKRGGRVNICCIKNPDFGVNRDIACDDVATFTAATYMSERRGKSLKYIELSDMGGAEKVIVTKDKCTIIKGYGSKEAIDDRIEQLSKQIEDEKILPHKDFLKFRRAQLQSGIGIMYVGGITETEIAEKRDRIDDAICATRAALEEGYVAGGGSTYFFCNVPSDGDNSSQIIGMEIIKNAILSPIKQILHNAGMEVDLLHELKKKKYGFGIDVRKEKVCDLLNGGIIDPAKVTRVALENAASIAGIFLTTECVISEKPRS